MMSAGYAALNRRLWVLMIPVVMNVLMGGGVRLSFAPFFSLHHDQVARVAALISRNPEHQRYLVGSLQSADMRQPLAVLHFVPLLPNGVLHQGGLRSEHAILVRSLGGVLGSALVINLAALLASSLFLVGLTRAVTANGEEGASRGSPSPSPSVGAVLVVAIRIVSYVLLLAVGVLVAGLPALVLSISIVLKLPLLTIPVFLGWFVLWFWFSVSTGFGIEALVLSGVGPVQALLRSLRLVRHNLLSALGLVVLSMVITSGLGVVWSALAQTPVGLALALVGSAYIGSGLAAARLVFYRERLVRRTPGAHQGSSVM